MLVAKEMSRQLQIETGCCILAGGKSLRMGQDKALLEYEGKKFIERLCEELDFFPEKYIARGNNPDCKVRGWKNIEDLYPGKGPMAGIHATLLSCQAEAMFFTTCDMPLLKRNLAELLLSALEEGIDAVIAVTADERKHPLCGVYRKSTMDIFEKQLQSGNYRMMDALNKLQVRYLPFSEEDSLQLQNINTREDYLLSILRGSSI